MRCHDQSFVGMFRLISLISLIAVGMALLAGVLAWFIVQPSAVSGKAGRPTSLASQSAISTEKAYAIVGDTQRELDYYVEERFEGIITVRNRLMAVHALTGVVTYVALLFALAVGISVGALQAMAALFLVGALASMLNWYTLIVGSDNALPDYGLSLTRLFAAPLLSGLVALAAVLLLQSLTWSLAGHAPNSSQSLANF
jgi:hypothetical protein